MSTIGRREFSAPLAAGLSVGWPRSEAAPPGGAAVPGKGGLTDIPGIKVGHFTDPRRPDAKAGYEAARVASEGPVAEGCVGAGAGATVGKLLGLARAMKGGLGTAAAHLPGGAVVAALVVVAAGAALRRPLTMVPENAMKYAVALLLSSFGLFWVIEGIGFFGPAGVSLQWPGGTAALPVILLVWIVVSQATVALLRGLGRARREGVAS